MLHLATNSKQVVVKNRITKSNLCDTVFIIEKGKLKFVEIACCKMQHKCEARTFKVRASFVLSFCDKGVASGVR